MRRKKRASAFAVLLRLTIDIVLVITAVALGFYLPKKLFGIEHARTEAFTGTEAVVNANTVKLLVHNLVYELGEDNKLKSVIVSTLNCSRGTLSCIMLPADTGYIMSQKLYKNLSADNTNVPQSVRLAELYNYYGDEDCFEAGRLIIGEMLGITIDYYTAYEEEVFRELYSCSCSRDGICEGSFTVGEQEAKYTATDTAGSVKGLIARMYDRCITSFSMRERMMYLEVYDKLDIGDITFISAKGTMHNEGFTIDIPGTAALLYGAASEEGQIKDEK